MCENIPPVKRNEFTKGSQKLRDKRFRQRIVLALRSLMGIQLPYLGKHTRRVVFHELVQRHISVLSLKSNDRGSLYLAVHPPEQATVLHLICESVADVVYKYWQFAVALEDQDKFEEVLKIETDIVGILDVWLLWQLHAESLHVTGDMVHGWKIEADGKELADGTTESDKKAGPPSLGCGAEARGESHDIVIVDEDFTFGAGLDSVEDDSNGTGGSTVPDDDGDGGL